MDTSLEGRRAIICGSTQGIGRACAEVFAALGAEITLLARHAEGLEAVRERLPADHGQTHGLITADFSNPDQVHQHVGEYLDASGPVQILVNNSGGPPAGPAINAQPEDFLAAFNQHLICNHHLVQLTATGMREANYGRIINVISTSVLMPIKGLGVSNTIRGAVGNWARTLAAELGPFGITVNNVLPGFTATARLGSIIQGKASRAGVTTGEIETTMKESIPARRFAEPSEVANVAAFLASPAAGYVNGVNIPVDGGRLAAL